MLYEVTYERNAIYHSNLAEAETAEAVEQWFLTNKPAAKVIDVRLATSDSMRPGKPVITIAR